MAREENRCYQATVTNPYGSLSSGAQCYTTPPDLVPPTPPTAAVVPLSRLCQPILATPANVGVEPPGWWFHTDNSMR